MKHVKFTLFAVLGSILLLAGCASAQTGTGSGDSAVKEPFTATAEPLQLTQDESGANCIEFSFRIDNTSDQELKGVSYSYEFNEEAEEALGGIPLSFPASDPTDMTTEENVKLSSKLAISGFQVNQSIQIPEGTDSAGLEDAFQELTIHITWDSTEQTVSVPLKWSE